MRARARRPGTGSRVARRVDPRPRSLLVVAALFAWAGGAAILYGPIVPLAPPLVTEPVPSVAILYGVVDLAVAIGIFRLWPAARVTGIVVIVLAASVSLVRVGSLENGSSQFAPFGLLTEVLLPIAVDAAIVWALVRRWPART